MNSENKPANGGGNRNKKKPYYMKKKNNHGKAENTAATSDTPVKEATAVNTPADNRPQKAENGVQNNAEHKEGGNKSHGRNHHRNRRRGNGSGNNNNNNNQKPVEANDNQDISEIEENVAFDENDAVTVVEADESMVPEVVVSIEDETDPTPTVSVTGVRFKPGGKVYYFDRGELEIKTGSYVIVDTARGEEFGEVAFGKRAVKESALVLPLRSVIRVATEQDIKHNAENKQKEEEAFKICLEKVQKHSLDMKLIEAQYSFDNSKLLFYFTSANRVDFRELVKDLASVFKTRIELRQIGIRDEAKIMGGLGVCGRPLCCSTFLSDFVQVSIKMAKEQNLSLNSGKISGCCGRLMCCLSYEYKTYAEEGAKTPPVDATVKTPDGVGTVTESNALAGTVKVRLNDKPDTPPVLYKRDDVTVISRPKVKNDEE